MSKIAKRYSANEILKILEKQWLDTNDIKILASVSTNQARSIKKEITIQLKEEQYFLPNGLVPNERVVDYLKLNIKYLKKIAKERSVDYENN